jgi:hypothetical protein
MDTLTPALNQLPKNIEDVLKEEVQHMQDAAKQAKQDLDQRDKELDELKTKADQLAQKASPSTDPKELEKLRNEFQDIANKALKDVSPDKNINVFGDPASDDFRRKLDDRIHDHNVPLTTDNIQVFISFHFLLL